MFRVSVVCLPKDNKAIEMSVRKMLRSMVFMPVGFPAVEIRFKGIRYGA
jgi:hypothetical protein